MLLAASCSNQSAADPVSTDLCSLLTTPEIAHTTHVDEPIHVTKRLDSGSAYCLYGTRTQHLVTLTAAIRQSGTFRFNVSDPQLTDKVVHRVDHAIALAALDIPRPCADLEPAATTLIGTIDFSRGSQNGPELSCDFAGDRGSIQAHTYRSAFIDLNDMRADGSGVQLDSNGTTYAEGWLTDDGLDVSGAIADCRLKITIIARGQHLISPARAFVWRFIDAAKA